MYFGNDIEYACTSGVSQLYLIFLYSQMNNVILNVTEQVIIRNMGVIVDFL